VAEPSHSEVAATGSAIVRCLAPGNQETTSLNATALIASKAAASAAAAQDCTSRPWAAVYFCSANVSATFSARAAVLACAMFDATATTIRCRGASSATSRFRLRARR
jgi:hypothetical protein